VADRTWGLLDFFGKSIDHMFLIHMMGKPKYAKGSANFHFYKAVSNPNLLLLTEDENITSALTYWTSISNRAFRGPSASNLLNTCRLGLLEDTFLLEGRKKDIISSRGMFLTKEQHRLDLNPK